MSVDADPTAGVLIWLPGMNASPCEAVEASMDRGQATALAGDIRSAGKPLSGNVNCASDDGTSVVAYFHYDNGPTQAVQIDLSGCATVSAPGRSARTVSTWMRRDLSSHVPPAWAPYTSG